MTDRLCDNQAQIHNMHGPTVYKGTLEELLPVVARLNDGRAGLYRLRVLIGEHAYDLVPLDAVASYDVRRPSGMGQAAPPRSCVCHA